jgi:long-subunit acyl-CoA synthetase (AMP-forming)
MAEQVDKLTLPDLLLSCTRNPDREIGFLSAGGEIETSVTYSQLFQDAQLYAQRLISGGLQSEKTIVVASFSDHESHIKLFWACCLG